MACWEASGLDRRWWLRPPPAVLVLSSHHIRYSQDRLSLEQQEELLGDRGHVVQGQ